MKSNLFASSGTIDVCNGQQLLSFLGKITNDGTIMAGGAAQVSGVPACTGTVDIRTGAAISLLACAPSTQTVDFAATIGELAINCMLKFFDNLAGFGGSDAIALNKNAKSGFGFSNGVLTATGGTPTVASLTLAGSYTQQDFNVTMDAHGNTAITIASLRRQASRLG